ncbi:MAG: hypothetical protein N2316_02200 [Spirochaetes bacterium]|nr:hypothetical protein [Spirochaetota bacterium]
MMASKTIKVCLKLFSGLHREISIPQYDMQRGIVCEVKKGTRLRTLLHSIGMRNISSNVYFRRGERIGLWSKLEDGDEVQCFKPSGGG